MSTSPEKKMGYAEELPDQCPPDSAVDKAHTLVYRLLTTTTVVADSFDSYAKLGKENVLGRDPCGFASCSMTEDIGKLLSDLPKMRESNTHAAKLSIPAGVGKTKYKGKKNKPTKHFHFWCYANADLAKYVEDVIPLSEVANGD